MMHNGDGNMGMSVSCEFADGIEVVNPVANGFRIRLCGYLLVFAWGVKDMYKTK